MNTWITICDTCKREGWAESGADLPDGEVLADLVETAAKDVPNLRTRRVSCLMGCTHGCNVTVQSNGKLNYTLGNFEPDQDSAKGIVDWATLHSQSETDQVPYRTWPVAVKGHFVTRHPPLPDTE